jgi:two-component system OmpR family sensor kinase
MATDSALLSGQSATPAASPPRRLRWPSVVHSLQGRIYLTLGFLILLTLGIAGVAFFFLLGGYQDRLAVSTLRQIGGPVYLSVVAPPGSDFQAFSVSRQLATTATVGPIPLDPDVRILFVGEAGEVVGEASGTPRFLGERLDVDLTEAMTDTFIEGRLSASDGTRLDYLAAALSPEASERFGAEFVVLALPVEDRQSVLGDLTPRLLLAGGMGLAAAIIVGLLLSRSIYRPLQETTSAARNVARGRFDQQVAVEGTREARELAEAFNQMTDEVQRQQAALRDFLANASHDLQTPLTSINGFSQALLDGTVDEPEARSNAYRIIEEESRRLLRLVEGLLDLSRMEAGHVRVELNPVDVDDVLGNIGELFTLRARELNVRLEIIPSHVPPVAGDMDRLEQVLANLVDNALRHTPPGGNVVLSARRESDASVGIAVADTGAGIPEDQIPHLFDRYYRADRPGSEGGTGLGLAIARELVRAQKGEIQVESRDGVGTTFRILLRVHKTRPVATAEEFA